MIDWLDKNNDRWRINIQNSIFKQRRLRSEEWPKLKEIKKPTIWWGQTKRHATLFENTACILHAFRTASDQCSTPNRVSDDDDERRIM